jgi:glycosyltransferase involved in cell wall biosynthesis
MRWRRRTRDRGLVSVVMPVYDVAEYLPAALDSVLGQEGVRLEVVVVDDGSTDASGEVADRYAARDPRVRVVHIENRGLGAARNEGARHVTGDLLAFCDSDDVVPAGAYAAEAATLGRTGSDFVTGSILRWEDDGLHEPPWMRRLHSPPRTGIRAREHPEILGDVFAWNKLFRRSFWESAELAWPEGVRYEDQPTITRAYLAGRFDVVPDVVYHWRIRSDGTSITQQRSTEQDLADRFATKRMSMAAVTAYGDATTSRVFLDRVLAGDLHRYFTEIPGCSDAWWDLLRTGVRDLWGAHSLVDSGLPPVHRLTGWLVEQGRREDAAAVMTYAASLTGPFPRVPDDGAPRLDLAGLEALTEGRLDDVPLAAVALRPHEV